VCTWLQTEGSCSCGGFISHHIFAAGGTTPEGFPGIDLLDANVRFKRKAVYGVVHVTHNMTLSDPNDLYNMSGA
jgi:hypothetical protein